MTFLTGVPSGARDSCERASSGPGNMISQAVKDGGIGDVAFVTCHGETAHVPVTGWIVHVSESVACLATALGALEKVASKTSYKSGSTEIGVIKVSLAALRSSRPDGWTGLKVKDLPSWSACQKAWTQVADRDLNSSEAEPKPTEKPAKGKSRIEQELGSLKSLFGAAGPGDDSDEDEEETDEDDGEALEPRGFLRPGASSKRKEKPKKKEKESAPNLAKALAGGQSAADLLPLALLAMLGNEKKEKKRGRSSRSEQGDLDSRHGGSSSDESEDGRHIKNRGLRAVSTLHRLHDRIQKKPLKICETYEREIREEMGVIPGQSWTMRDYVKKQPWGKFKGIYRCMMMDVAAYEQLRAGNHEVAGAQLVQNMKAKLQSVLQGGDWSAAWLLTGLPDPMQKRDFAGTREEMPVVSGYVEALANLRKKVKEAQAGNAGEEDEEPVGNDVPLFPALLPYPEASFVEEVADSDSALLWWAKSFVNTFVGWSNFVVLGCPALGSSALEPRVFHRGDVQLLSEKLLGEVVEFVNVGLAFDSLEFSGNRSVLEEMLRLNCASYGVGQVPAPSGALAVAADRVAVPELAGVVDPLDWLPPSQAMVVEHLEDIRLPEHAWGETVVACHRVPKEHEGELARKLLRAGMAKLVAEKDLPRTSEGRLLCGGLFSVEKDQHSDRLIYDRRPENATMPSLGWEALPSGACYVRMLLEPHDHEYLKGSGDDLKNFYYMLKLPAGWVRFNPVGRRVPKKIVEEFGGDPALDHRLCFRVLGMGDKNACSIAQATHESILKKGGLLDSKHKLVYGENVPDDALWEGIYLDDLLITLKVATPDVIPLDGEVQGLGRRGGRGGWPRRGPLEMRRQLWALLARTVRLGRVTKEILEKLAGFIAFVFQYTRECFALLHHFYVFTSKLPAGKSVRLPGYIADELRAVALHLPMASWNMRARLSRSLLATDATPTSGGAARAPISQALARELWRRSKVRGAPVRLEPGSEGVLAEAPIETSKFAACISPCLRWQVEGSYTFKKTHHINLQEARALKREIVKLASHPGNIDTIQVALNDSTVVVGAECKGRSSSFRLNGILNAQLPFLIFGGVHLRCFGWRPKLT
ncbi:unnamed protein product [Symbiodinium sp. CCMP2592]|nr:unnamed protein product [Symbiodinium sp. CCMP2592]